MQRARRVAMPDPSTGDTIFLDESGEGGLETCHRDNMRAVSSAVDCHIDRSERSRGITSA